MNPKLEKGLIGAAVLAALDLMLPIAKQSKEFMNCRDRDHQPGWR